MATVTVGCKLAQGFIMELVEPGHLTQPAPRGPIVKIAGANTLRIPGTNPLVGQFALTQVDKALADEWFKRNKDLKFVRDGLVFIDESASHAASVAKERAGEKTGLEPLNPDAPPKGMQPDKDQLARLGVVT